MTLPIRFRAPSLFLAGLSLVGLLTSLGSGPEPTGQAAASRTSPGVTHVRIEGALDRGTQALLVRALDEAATRGDRFLVELDTPGGEVELMWQLSRTLLSASDKGLRTVAWVNDQALSAGALLALSCDLLYMRGLASIGSALPVQIGVGGLVPVAEDKEVREKLLSSFRTEFRSVAEARGRPGVLAEAMVDPSVGVVEVEVDGERRLLSRVEWDDLRMRRDSEPRFLRTVVEEGRIFNVNGEEALALGLVDGVAESLDDVIARLGVGRVEPTLVRRTRSEDVAGLLHVWTPLLLILGFVFAYLELKVPGFGIPGGLSIACFGLVVFGRYLVGLADVPHVVLITAGIALLALELFVVPGTIWVGVVGGLAALAGLVWSFAGAGTGFAYPLDRQILFDESFRVLSSAFAALLAVWGLSRVLPKTPIFGRMVLGADAPVESTAGAMPEAAGAHARIAHVGALGHALTPLRPVGKVRLDGDASIDFEARADGAGVERGARVRVVETTGSGRIVVAATDEGSTT